MIYKIGLKNVMHPYLNVKITTALKKLYNYIGIYHKVIIH